MNEDRWLLICFWLAVLIGALLLFAQDPGPGPNDQLVFNMAWNRFAKSVDAVGERLAAGVLDLKAIERMEKAEKALKGNPNWPKR